MNPGDRVSWGDQQGTLEKIEGDMATVYFGTHQDRAHRSVVPLSELGTGKPALTEAEVRARHKAEGKSAG